MLQCAGVALQEATWRHVKASLCPGGRVMANLGCFKRAEVALGAMADIFGTGMCRQQADAGFFQRWPGIMSFDGAKDA